MGPVGHPWLPSAWPTPRLALTAPFVFSAPRLPCSLLLKPSDCAGLGQSLGPSPGRGCSASAELGFVPLPAVAGTSCAIPPWHRVPRLGAQLGRCVGSDPPCLGAMAALSHPPSPMSHPAVRSAGPQGPAPAHPGHPQLSRARARCVQLQPGHVAPPNPCCCGPCPAPCGHHEDKQDGRCVGQGDGTIPGDTSGTLPPALHPTPCKV